MPPDLPHPDLLLAHGDWVRALARRLVHNDEQLAEDVVQETWMAALAARRSTDVPAWLVGVVRNLARRALRTRERRSRHEALGNPGTEPPSPAEIVEREQTRRRVVEAVLALEEPYRSTLLLRYYEDLAPVEIARRLRIPAATVRTRLKRGLERLRGELAPERDGARGERLSALAILAGARPPGRAIGTATGVGSGWQLAGGLLMAIKSGLGLAGVSVALLCLWWAFNRGPAAPTGELASPLALGEPATGTQEAVLAPLPTRDAVVAQDKAPVSAAPGDAWRLSITRGKGRLLGQVIDLDSQAPLEGVELLAAAVPGPMPRGFELAEDREAKPVRTVSDAGGAFAFPDLPSGPYRVRWTDREQRTDHAVLVVPEGEERVRLALGGRDDSRPRKSLTVRVEDAAGASVVGARVTLTGSGQGVGWLQRSLVTDERGLACFEDAWLLRGILMARAGEGEEGCARVDLFRADGILRKLETIAGARGEPLEVIRMRLEKPGRLEGRVVRAPQGAVVHAWARSWRSNAYASARVEHRADVDAEGAFAFTGLPAGVYVLSVSGTPGMRLVLPRLESGELGALEVELAPGETLALNLELLPAPILEGEVLRAEDGVAIEGALVRVTVPQGLRSDPDRVQSRGVHVWVLQEAGRIEETHPSFVQQTRTGADGRYRFDGLPPGVDLRVEVSAAGRSYARAESLRLIAEETRVLRHELELAGGLQGVARGPLLVGLRREPASALAIVFRTPDDPTAAFTLLGLEGGRWEACALHSTESIPPVVLARFEIEPGALAWLDLREAAPFAARGTVLLRGAPLEGAVLDFFGGQVVTDTAGGFVHAFPFAHSNVRSLDLHAPVPHAVPLRVLVPGMCSAAPPWSGTIELPEGRLEVQLLDSSGAGTPGTVTLTAREGGGLSIGPGGEEKGGAQIGFQLHWRPLTRPSSGERPARFELLPAGRYEVSGRTHAGELLGPVEVDFVEGESRLLELRAGDGGALEVLLQAPDGTPIAGVELSIWRPGATQSQELAILRTDLQGRVRMAHLPVGEVRVSILDALLSARQPTAQAQIRQGETADLVMTWDRAARR